jgi:hypothetical protein
MRVHELAKKLGLKSQDLIDFIKKEGLDVKPSTFAGIDPDMVSRIEQLYLRSASGAASAAPPKATPPRPAKERDDDAVAPNRQRARWLPPQRHRRPPRHGRARHQSHRRPLRLPWRPPRLHRCL